jgi:hypothetical protein
MRRYFFAVIIGLIIINLSGGTTGQAQEAAATHTFTWRSAGLILQYPAGWQVGAYEGNPVLASTAEAMENASDGDAPGAPTLTFLHYPQTGNISPTDLLKLAFPERESENISIGGVNGIVSQFEDEATAQTVRAVVFNSPLTKQAHLLVAVAPSETWATFEPVLDAMLASVQFLGQVASLEFAGGIVLFNYPTGWQTAANGQVVVASADVTSATSILDGKLQDASPFIRAQLLIPSGIGVDPEVEDAPRQILETFTGQTLGDVREFEWGEDGLPAAASNLEFEGLQLLLVAIVDGDSALLIGGGSTIEAWATMQAIIDGALNLSVYNEQAAPLELENLLQVERGIEDGPFGMVQ